jgi:hypothetical protein
MRLQRRMAWYCIVGVLVLLVGSGCGGEAPVDHKMHTANEIVNRFCDPIPGRTTPHVRDLRRALLTIADREVQQPRDQFRIDDSEQPTTPGALLKEFEQLSVRPRCRRLITEIHSAQRTSQQ